MPDVYDDEKVNTEPSAEELKQHFESSDAQESGSDIAKRNAETKQLEDAYDAPAAEDSGSKKLSKKEAEDAEKLRQREEHADKKRGFSAADDARERLGLGYTGEGSSRSKALSKLFGSNSALKKRVAIAGALAGSSLIAGIAAFLVLIPLKLENVMHMVNDNYSASVMKAMDKETETLVGQYMATRVIPALKAPSCAGKTFTDATCVSKSDDVLDNPVSKTFRAWKEQGIERRLASKGVLLGKKANGQLYIRYNNVDTKIEANMAKKIENLQVSIFDLPDSGKVDRAEFRRVVRETVKTMSFRDRMYMRFRLSSLLAHKYGVRRCAMICKITDPVAEKITTRKQFAKAFLVQRVITPRNEALGLALECLMQGTCGKGSGDAADVDDVDPESGTQNRLTQYQSSLKERLAAYRAASIGRDSAEDLAKIVDDIEKEGTGKYLTRTILEKVLKSEAAAQAVTSATGPVKIVLLVLQALSLVDSAATGAKQLSYALNVGAVAIPLYMAYQNSVDEVHGGAPNLDINKVGSMMNMLDNNNISLSESPVYSRLAAGYTTAPSSISTQAFLPTAFAESASGSTGSDNKYRCQDGEPAPAEGCNELRTAQGVTWLNGTQEILNTIPGLRTILDTYKSVREWFGKVVEPILQPIADSALVKSLGDLAQALASPLTDMMMKYISNNFLVNTLLDDSNSDSGTTAATVTGKSPLSKLSPKAYAADINTDNTTLFPSGARMFELIAMGADASYNDSCISQMGCVRVSDAEAAAIRDEYIADKREQFSQQGMFSRMFSTSTPYSFVSRLSLTMPNSATDASHAGILSLGSTIGSVFGSFSSLLSGKSTAAPVTDFFGISQNAIPESGIAGLGNQEAFWETNCKGARGDAYNQAWRESLQTDENTGVAYATRVNWCQFLSANTIANGGYGDPSMLPAETGSNTGTPASSTSTVGTIPTGSTKELAKQILENPNITFQTPQREFEFRQIASTGGGTDPCGNSIAVNAKLLGVILALSQKYKLVLGVVVTGHGCVGTSSSDHLQGLAIDINGVNPLTGSGGTGNTLSYSDYALPIVKNFYIDIAKLESQNGGGKINQYQCFKEYGAQPPDLSSYPNVITSYLVDPCTHLHMAVKA